MDLRGRVSGEALVAAIDQILPQTQCTRCGYPACRPYAEAIAKGEANINQCPPGGEAGIRKLALLLDRSPEPLNPANGTEGLLQLAFIDEAACIGCTLCIQACPVDAIIGASRQMHTVLTELCTGCDLCLPPCPVDCITMIRAPEALSEWTAARAGAARERFEARSARLQSEQARSDTGGEYAGPEARHAMVRAAMERARDLQTPHGTGIKEKQFAKPDRQPDESGARQAAPAEPGGRSRR